MKILFIISESIAAKKNLNTLNILKKKEVYINNYQKFFLILYA